MGGAERAGDGTVKNIKGDRGVGAQKAPGVERLSAALETVGSRFSSRRMQGNERLYVTVWGRESNRMT